MAASPKCTAPFKRDGTTKVCSVILSVTEGKEKIVPSGSLALMFNRSSSSFDDLLQSLAVSLAAPPQHLGWHTLDSVQDCSLVFFKGLEAESLHFRLCPGPNFLDGIEVRAVFRPGLKQMNAGWVLFITLVYKGLHLLVSLFAFLLKSPGRNPLVAENSVAILEFCPCQTQLP